MIPEAALLIQLPPVPERFHKELAQVATYGEYPMFRMVDGQRELTFRNGEWETKHLLHTEGQNCYVRVDTCVFRRKNIKTGEYEQYSSYEAAKNDKNKDLAATEFIEEAHGMRIHAIGKPCWVIEVYVKPEEICYDTWQAKRFQWMDYMGVQQKVDIFGEYPRNGMYIWCFDVIDKEGNAVPPSDKTLDECRRRFKIAAGDTRTVNQAIQCDLNDAEIFAQKQRERMNDNFMQWAGISANRLRGGVIGKPIAVKQ